MTESKQQRVFDLVGSVDVACSDELNTVTLNGEAVATMARVLLVSMSTAVAPPR